MIVVDVVFVVVVVTVVLWMMSDTSHVDQSSIISDLRPPSNAKCKPQGNVLLKYVKKRTRYHHHVPVPDVS